MRIKNYVHDMPQKKLPSIPLELQESKAYQLYQQRIAEGKDTNSEEDWDKAWDYLVSHPQEVVTWKFKRRIKRFWQSCWKIITFTGWLLLKLPELFAETDTRVFALDVVKTLITALGLIATFVAGVGLFINYWSSEKNIQLTQERLITDRFSKAIEQLGSSQETMILGGIYSLERIANDSAKDQWTIMEVLTSYIRNKSPILIEKKPRIRDWTALVNSKPVSLSVQAALTVIGRRNVKNDRISGNSVSGEKLNFINLIDADLIEADLSDANLSNADLIEADLSDANLSNANLSNANLIRADLREANLIRANLREADLREANLIRANLREANLSRAKNLVPAQIKAACYWDKAIYVPGKLEELKRDKASDPKETVDCSLWNNYYPSIRNSNK